MPDLPNSAMLGPLPPNFSTLVTDRFSTLAFSTWKPAQGHALLGADRDTPGYFMRNLLEYDWLAVTGACLMVGRDKFNKVGGFSEDLPIAYNDIDLCMRLVDQGLYNVVVPAVCLTHHESISRGVDHHDPEKHRRLILDRKKLYDRNPSYYQRDPFHNPNLHPDGIHFEVPTYF